MDWEAFKREGARMSADDSRLKDLQRQLAKIQDQFGKLAGDQAAPTFGEFAKTFLQRKEMDPSLRASTKRIIKHQVTAHLIPTFGQLPIDKVTNVEFLTWVTKQR